MTPLLLVLAVSATNLFADNFAPLVYFYDVPPGLKQLAEQDIALLYSLEATEQSSLHKQIFNGADGKAYERYLRSQVRHIGYSDCGNSGSAACAEPMYADTTIWLTDKYQSASLPQILRAQIFLHERKHLEPGGTPYGWSHIECPSPYLDESGQDIKSLISGKKFAGFYACDQDHYGSFAVGVSMLYQVAKNCSNCSEKVKQDAKLYADEYVQLIIEPKSRAMLRE
jgi:hypothetical protein